MLIQELPAHLLPSTLMWLHLSKKTSLIWRRTQPTPSLSQQGTSSHALQQAPWVEAKRLLTFREELTFFFPPFIVTAQQLPVVSPTGHPSPWWGVSKAAATSPGERGGDQVLPALEPGPSSQTTPWLSAFSFIFSHRQNVSALLLALDGASCRNHWH